MFRNKLYILLLLFTSSICSAQIINTIGVYYEINSTKPLFISNRPVLSGDTLEYKDTNVYDNSGNAFGVNIEKFFGKKNHFKFTTGVGYSKRGYSFDGGGKFLLADGTSKLYTLKKIVEYTDIELPIIFSYQHKIKRIRVFAGTGVILGFKIEDSYTTIIYKDPQEYITYIDAYNDPGPERLNIFFTGGIGYFLNNNLGIFIAPNLRINIRPFFGNGVVAFDEETKTKSLKVSLKYIIQNNKED